MKDEAYYLPRLYLFPNSGRSVDRLEKRRAGFATGSLKAFPVELGKATKLHLQIIAAWINLSKCGNRVITA
jgi:hypothetical protein